MATTLSLKELRSSSTLKTEISDLQAEKQLLLEQIEREIQVQKKLQNDLLEQKKDFEHLEKQFEHFAEIESDFEALQSEIQMERLEKMIDGDKKDTQHSNLIKKAKEDSTGLQRELKDLKKLDPQRLKRQVVDLKKKAATQAAENKVVNKALVNVRKELKEMTGEKEQFEADHKASLTKTDFFWQSINGNWTLYESRLTLKDEKFKKGEEPKRVLCLNNITGQGVVSKEIGTKGKQKDLAIWTAEVDIPEDVAKEAGKRLKKFASDLEDED